MTMQVERVKAFDLPDGSFIKVECYDGNVGAHDNDPGRGGVWTFRLSILTGEISSYVALILRT